MVKTAGNPRVRLIMRWRKVLARMTTLHTNWRLPISDWSSTKRTEWRFVKEAGKSHVRCSLSSGSCASMRMESNSMPINSNTWKGPSVLDLTTRAWINIKKQNKVLNEDRCCKWMGLAIKKSSSIWSTYCKPYLRFKTHSRASNNCLKRKGAEQSPKGRYRST